MSDVDNVPLFYLKDCVWGQGECDPDCLNCKRLDELIAERAAGYAEGIRASIAAVEEMDGPAGSGPTTKTVTRADVLEILRELVGSDD